MLLSVGQLKQPLILTDQLEGQEELSGVRLSIFAKEAKKFALAHQELRRLSPPDLGMHEPLGVDVDIVLAEPLKPSDSLGAQLVWATRGKLSECGDLTLRLCVQRGGGDKHSHGEKRY